MKKTITFFVLLFTLCYYLPAQELTVQTVSNTSCSAPNGSASALVGGTAEGYTFEWRAGTDESAAVFFIGPVASNLSAGIYSVRAIDQSTSSDVGTVHAVVSDNIVLPEVMLQSAPNTYCTADRNGSLTAIVNGVVGNTDHTFAWYEGLSAEGVVIATGSVLEARGSGTYTVRVTDVITSCVTVATGVIEDAIVLPLVTISTSNNTDCFSPNGELTAFTEGPALTYIFEWYAGTETFGDILLNTATLSNVAGGNYTVRVTEITTGCITIVTAQVIDDCPASPGFRGAGNELVTNQKKADSPSISYYPNPASTAFFILSQVNATVSLIDREGTTIVTQNVSPSSDPFTIGLSGVKPGKYILRVREVGKTTSYQVIVKK